MSSVIFTEAMRDHDKIVRRAGRKALGIFTACLICSAGVFTLSILVSLAL